MEIEPNRGRILVKVEAGGEEVSRGGIVIPEISRRKPVTRGEVVAIGDEVDARYFHLGEEVIFDRFSGVEVRIRTGGEDRMFLIIKASDVLGVEK